jgi:hypothetical protein
MLNTESPSKLTASTVTERNAAEEHDVRLDLPQPAALAVHDTRGAGRRLITGQFAQ